MALETRSWQGGNCYKFKLVSEDQEENGDGVQRVLVGRAIVQVQM